MKKRIIEYKIWLLIKGEPSSKTKYDIVSDSGNTSTVREHVWKVILKAAGVF